jgi:hypothetical protein
VAQANLGRFRPDWKKQVPVAAKAGDALRFELPAGPLVLYLYHPFAAPVMSSFLDRVEESLRREPRELWLLYTNPELDPLLRERRFLERRWDQSFAMSEEDAGADAFGSQWERFVAYRARA